MRATRYFFVISHLLLVSTVLAAFTYEAAEADAGASDGDRLNRTVEDAWIAGKLESAYLLNEHLNPFDIDIEVEDGVVELSGAVDSDIQKELAGRIAEGVEGVSDVHNGLAIKPSGGEPVSAPQNGDRGFAQWVNDASTTAVVKTKLAANEHINSLDIDVDTERGVVTLTGKVRSAEARTLAEVIASNSRNVRRVENELVVESAESASSKTIMPNTGREHAILI